MSQFIHAVYVGLQNYRIILILVNECHFSNSAHILVSSRHNNLFLSSLSNSFFLFASSTILILFFRCHTTSINVYFVTFLNISHFLFLFLRLRALDYCRFTTLFFLFIFSSACVLSNHLSTVRVLASHRRSLIMVKQFVGIIFIRCCYGRFYTLIIRLLS